jgi:hypothetical protein
MDRIDDVKNSIANTFSDDKPRYYSAARIEVRMRAVEDNRSYPSRPHLIETDTKRQMEDDLFEFAHSIVRAVGTMDEKLAFILKKYIK